MAKRKTERGFDRLVNFSDAIVAIAITLLVLPLTDLAGDEADGFLDLWQQNKGVFYSFALSFVIVALFWLKHHDLFEHIGSYDLGLAWLNMAWLALIVVLPFTTSLISAYGYEDGSGTAYLIVLAGLSGLLGVMARYVAKRPELQAQDLRPGELSWLRSAPFTAFFIILAVVALPFPDAAQKGMFLLIPLGFLANRWESRLDD